MTEVGKWKRRADSSSEQDIPPRLHVLPLQKQRLFAGSPALLGLPAAKGLLSRKPLSRSITGRGNGWTLVLSRWIQQLQWHWCSQAMLSGHLWET